MNTTNYIVRVSFQDGSNYDYVQAEFSAIGAISVVALRLANVASTLKSSVVSVALSPI